MEVVAKLPTAEQRDNELKTVLKAISAFRRGVNLNAINAPGIAPYRNFDGSVIRAQFQLNY